MLSDSNINYLIRGRVVYVSHRTGHSFPYPILYLTKICITYLEVDLSHIDITQVESSWNGSVKLSNHVGGLGVTYRIEFFFLIPLSKVAERESV